MSHGERLGHLNNLAGTLVRTEINRGSHCSSAHVESLLDRSEHDLIKLIGVGQQFVVIDFYQEGDLMGVFASHYTEHAKGRGHRIATAFNGEFDYIFSIEVIRVLGKAGTSRVF